MGHGKVRKTNTDMLHRQTNTYIERERERGTPCRKSWEPPSCGLVETSWHCGPSFSGQKRCGGTVRCAGSQKILDQHKWAISLPPFKVLVGNTMWGVWGLRPAEWSTKVWHRQAGHASCESSSSHCPESQYNGLGCGQWVKMIKTIQNYRSHQRCHSLVYIYIYLDKNILFIWRWTWVREGPDDFTFTCCPEENNQHRHTNLARFVSN